MTKTHRSPHTILAALMVAGALLGTSVAAYGQDRGAAREETAVRGEAGGDADADSDADAATADTDEVNEGDGKVKVFKFTGLDISGRLKSPQLLYFLNRLRAEFDRPRLPHRSFMPELERSAKSKAF